MGEGAGEGNKMHISFNTGFNELDENQSDACVAQQ